MSSTLGLEDEKPGGGDAAPDITRLEAEVKSGANWFYWIAGLSVINSLIFAFGGNVAFIAGLGFMQVIDAIAQAAIDDGGPTALRAVAVGFDLVFVIVFALAGYYANKRFIAAFAIGALIYIGDTVLVLFLDLFMAAFHAFALFFIIRGFLACRKIRTVVPPIQGEAAAPPPPPPTF